MYWSAAMSLKTPTARDKTPNYGSFGASKTLTAASRTSSGGNIRIPQSIPEHQCLLHFASPRLHQYEEEKLAEYYEMEQAAQSYASKDSSSTTVTVTASTALQMLLLGSRKLDLYSSTTTSSTASTSSESSYTSHSSDHAYVEMHSMSELHHSSSASTSQNSAALFSYLNGSFASEASQEIAAARVAGEDSDQINYWVLERDRLRAKRERRHLLSKKAALSGDVVDDEPASAWRTGVIMCSVPLLLIILFAVFVVLSGEGGSGASAVAPSAWELIVSTVTGKTSDSTDDSIRTAERESVRAALRGSG